MIWFRALPALPAPDLQVNRSSLETKALAELVRQITLVRKMERP